MDALAVALQAAIAHHQAKRLPEAEKLYRQVLAAAPQHAQALHLLGMLAVQSGHLDDGFGLMERSLALAPRDASLLLNYGMFLHRRGRLAKAIGALRRAIELGQNDYAAYTELGYALMSSGDLAAAEPMLRRVIELEPRFSGGYTNLGLLHVQRGEFAEGIALYRKAIELDPNDADVHMNLSLALAQAGEIELSSAELQTTLELDPANTSAHVSLGNIAFDRGEVREAIGLYGKALKFQPDYLGAESNMLLAMHCLAEVSPKEMFAAHVAFGRRIADAAPRLPERSDIDRDPDRRLRIGYVSPDFREHSVTAFIAPVLANHDHAQFEIFCYADMLKSDAMTNRLRNCADHWRNCTGLADDVVAQMIRDDRVDLLIDLAGHTNGNRLMVFARKPSPVQVTWLGYPNTTGMRAMDWRITDAITDSPGESDALHVEKLMRLPDCFLCYQPPAETIESGEPPVVSRGHVTFGSFNRLAKVSDETIRLWARVMKAVPDSKLKLKSAGLIPAMVPQCLDRLTRNGLDLDRVQMIVHVPSFGAYLEQLGEVDIALDTFPYNGTTVTCQTLWMGVPVVSLVGQTHVARVGKLLLSMVGLNDFALASEDAYVQAAATLANDVERLRALRRELRTRLVESPLTNAAAFTRSLENAYRQMWRDYALKPR